MRRLSLVLITAFIFLTINVSAVADFGENVPVGMLSGRNAGAPVSDSTGIDAAVVSEHSLSLREGTFDIKWSRVVGSTGWDTLVDFVQTPDGGYLAIGSTNSNTMPGYHGGTDVWLVKFNSLGVLQWQKCYGGADDEYSGSIIKTRDGNYVFLASTYSSGSGDVPVTKGYSDLWVAKINQTGKILWSRTFGGSDDDHPGSNWVPSVMEDSGGNLVLYSQTSSTNGNVTDNHGSSDLWLIRLNKDGRELWNHCYGGSGSEWISEFPPIQLLNGNYMVIGATASNDMQVSGNHGDWDTWLIEVNMSAGSLKSQKCFGGTSSDWGKFVIQIPGGAGYLMGSQSYSSDLQVPVNHGSSDAWITKLSSGKAIIWSRCFGGSDTDVLFWARAVNSTNYVLSGRTYSTDGTITGNHGSGDGWIINLNQAGNTLWQRCFGGSNEDGFCNIIPRASTENIFTGWTSSNDGDVLGANHGSYDGWIVNYGVARTWPPASITNLRNITYARTFINWTWKDPKDPDLANVRVYINGIFKKNVPAGAQFYYLGGLSSGKKYTIGTQTVDIYRNFNKTWVNKTTWTRP